MCNHLAARPRKSLCLVDSLPLREDRFYGVVVHICSILCYDGRSDRDAGPGVVHVFGVEGSCYRVAGCDDAASTISAVCYCAIDWNRGGIQEGWYWW